MDVKVYENLKQYENNDSAGVKNAEVDGNENEYFYIKMEDDSMEPVLKKNEYVLFHIQSKAKSGSVVLAMSNGSHYIRTIDYDKDFLTLKAENPSYEKLFFAGFSLGKVKIKAAAV